jgi:hypothetical protein
MFDRDNVIRHAKTARDNHADIAPQLNAYLTATTPAEERFAERKFRDMLVACAAGHDMGCHDGSTHDARIAAAKAALVAWDGPAEDNCKILVGSRTLSVPRDLARTAGFDVCADGTVSFRGDPLQDLADVCRAIDELSGDASDEDVLHRVVANRLRLTETRNAASAAQKLAEEQSKAAGMTLAAKRFGK